MRMRLHLNSVIGDEYIYPIYDIDYDTLKLMSGYSTTIAPTETEGYTITKWIVGNQTGIIARGLPATVPRKPEQEGNILPWRYTYNNLVDDAYYLERFFDPAYFEAVEGSTMPADWGSRTDYVTCPYYTQTYRHLRLHMPGVTNDFIAGHTYIDKKKMLCRVFYTDKGGHFSVFKAGDMANASSFNTCQWAAGRPPTYISEWTSDAKQRYMFVSDKSDRVMSESLLIARSTNSNLGGGVYNSNWIFVHFTINGLQYYGIAEVFYSSFSDNPIPTGLSVIGVDKSFWDENIVPGGVPGEGSWGPTTHTGGGAGDWTFPSDSRGNGSAATGQAIAQDAKNCLDAFFTNATGFKLHQLDPADIPAIYGALYDNSFLDKYVHSMFNPLSACLSMHMIPEKLLDTQNATTKTDLTLSGYNVSTNVTHKTYPQMPVIYSHHIEKIYLDYMDNFMDFAPYTNAYLHLPYIGVITLDINAIAHGELAIDYITDATNGNCSALVWCKDMHGADAIKYVAQGNAAYSLPMFSNTQDGSAIGKLLSSGISLAASGFLGDTAGQIRAAGGLLSGVFDAAAAKQNTQITGSFAGNVSMVSDTVCWLELVRPCWCEQDPEYQQIKGIPSQLAGTMLDYGDGVPYVGFLRVQDIETDGITASAQEIAEIERLLRAGVFVDWQQDS